MDLEHLDTDKLVAGITALVAALSALAVAVRRVIVLSRALRAVIRGVEQSNDDDVKTTIKINAEDAGVETALNKIVTRETKRLEAEKVEGSP